MNILHRGDATREKLDALDARIERLQAEIEATRVARFPHEETEARFRKALEAAIDARVVPYAFGGWQGAIAYQPERTLDPAYFSLAELAWILGVDEIVAKVMERIAENGKPVGLPAEARAKRIEELQQQVVSAMRDAEREAMALEDRGFNPGRQLHGDELRGDEALQARLIWDVWATHQASAGSDERPT